jgi:hypothetical protein
MSLTLSQIEMAFSQAVSAIQDIPTIAWPNRMIDPPRPFVMFQHNPGAWTDRTVTGGMTISSGTLLVTVVTNINEFSFPANALADNIMAAFPKGRRIIVRDWLFYPLPHFILINSPPRPIVVGQDGADWRLAVEINYTTETV